MPQTLDIEIKTLTPLWTGGIDGTCDRLHISGLMGSLRYWYEAIVRGADGYACDPSEGKGCIYKPFDEKYPDTTGNKSICAACYLFGTTGWARLFRLTAMVNDAPGTVKAEEPLHFRTFPRIEKGNVSDPNAWWLGKVFNIDRTPLAALKTIYLTKKGAICLRFVGNNKWDYASTQIKMLFWFLAEYAGIGAKQQFGFGCFDFTRDSTEWIAGLQALQGQLSEHLHKPNKPDSETVFDGLKVYPPDLRYFFAVRGDVKDIVIKRPVSLPRASPLMNDRPYLSSSFDIRFKGDESMIGLRTWVRKSWGRLETSTLLGASPRTTKSSIPEKQRSSSNIFVTMPMQKGQGVYELRCYGFAPMNIRWEGYPFDAELGVQLCIQYFKEIDATQMKYATISNFPQWKDGADNEF